MTIVYDDSMSIWAGRSETRMASGRNFSDASVDTP
ncbi:hypothetical protein PGAAJM_00220 [Kocuria varians]